MITGIICHNQNGCKSDIRSSYFFAPLVLGEGKNFSSPSDGNRSPSPTNLQHIIYNENKGSSYVRLQYKISQFQQSNMDDASVDNIRL